MQNANSLIHLCTPGPFQSKLDPPIRQLGLDPIFVIVLTGQPNISITDPPRLFGMKIRSFHSKMNHLDTLLRKSYQLAIYNLRHAARRALSKFRAL